MKRTPSTLLAVLANIFLLHPSLGMSADKSTADNTAVQKAGQTYNKASEATQEAVQDVTKVAKKTYRDVDDKTCKMVNGKMECLAKKTINRIKNGTDELTDKANDIGKD